MDEREPSKYVDKDMDMAEIDSAVLGAKVGRVEGGSNAVCVIDCGAAGQNSLFGGVKFD